MAVILVAEDDVFISELLEMAIQEMGHQVLVAKSADEALALLRSEQHIDALFTDIQLKEAIHGGFEIAQMAVRLRPDLRVLYASGKPVSNMLKALFVDGAQYLHKPYTHQRLMEAIEAMLERRF